MNKAMLPLATAVVGLLALPSGAAPLSPEETANHIGRSATVCGVVASTKFDAHLDRQPTFLDFGKPYPDEVFAAVIFGSDRAKFGTPETTLQGKRVCVSGTVSEYQNKPAIVLSDPRQLRR
jgi:hypothetical protein